MNIVSVRHLDGPNIYIYKPVMIARVDLEGLTERESYEFPGFPDRLLRTLPGLREHHCAKGAPGGFVERLYGGTYFGHIVEHVAIELACLAGVDVHFGRTVYAGGPGLYDIVMECRAYACQRYLLQAAIGLVEELLQGVSPSLDTVLVEAERILARTELGPSTRAIVEAAHRRNIPVRRLNEGSLIQLGYGKHRKLVEATVTERTSAVSVDIACDKELTKRLLAAAGIPVPDGELAEDAEGAVAALRRMGPPVVVKPYNGNQGRGVSLNLQSEQEVREAYEIARTISPRVLVERYVQGRNIRFLVVDGRFAAASERIPARVFGDGLHTVQELIELANAHPLRGMGHEKPLTRIQVDAVVMSTLRRQHLSLSSVPAPGQEVLLRASANLSTGGEAIDVTGDVHESYVRLAERIARIIGLDVCGIDMVVARPEAPCDRNGCTVIEVNAAPGIRMHEHPSYGSPRAVGERIVESLFPNGADGRIPIVSITGTNGKTTTTRLIAHVLAATGRTVGMTTTSGVWIGGERVLEGDTTGPDSARVVLSDPAVEVAVLETARGGIVRGGLAYDRANVAVITNISMDHFGQDGVETLEDLVHIKSLVGECVWEDGTVVLNADDERLVQLASRLPARVAYFSMSDQNPVLKRHLACGGVGYYVSRGWIVEGRGNLTWEVAPVRDIPLTMQGLARFHVENCLAAVAALRALGCTRQQVASGLTTFLPNEHNPGRCMLYQLPGGAYAVLDYGHNPDGFQRMGEWLRQVPHRRLIGVVGVPGDRIDPVIRQSGRQAAEIFDAFVVKEDADKRGRREGEVAALLAEEIRAHAPGKPCTVIASEPDALRFALSQAGPGDVVVMFFEQLAPAQQVVREFGGVPVAGFDVTAVQPFAAVPL
ncbi:MAG: cyanophycin synthetase [Alicyclobacillus macrosporangiidus]|uniref:cyanophycin synthetase n=1 Tax=Alicyclobacillus macrosporangiidus TaxID=392015 RepID=UPI0026EB872B|nr:cyanophycin synthetase [Alicyclobacillus macrosporangiidus]MCL6598738.1 cyanophycin synthetase [Alicyclobacillus macrosporangiidus]